MPEHNFATVFCRAWMKTTFLQTQAMSVKPQPVSSMAAIAGCWAHVGRSASDWAKVKGVTMVATSAMETVNSFMVMTLVNIQERAADERVYCLKRRCLKEKVTIGF